MRPEDAAAAEELAEVKQLQHQHLAQRIGIPGLQIEERHGKLHPSFMQPAVTLLEVYMLLNHCCI